MLRKAKIVVFDEATSNIDVRTEQSILGLITESMQDATVLTIAHRLNTIIKSNRIALLGEGRLLEYDTPEALARDHESGFSKLLQ